MITLEEGERIYLVKRRHPIILKIKNFPFLFFFFLTLILMGICWFYFSFSWPTIFIEIYPSLVNYSPRYFLLFLLSVFLLFLWTLLWFAILDYYLNCLVITNKRIIQVEMRGFFNLSLSSIFYDKIQDITISVSGFLASLFRFGDIQIETAGAFKQFIFSQIQDAEIVKQVILEAKKDYLEARN